MSPHAKIWCMHSNKARQIYNEYHLYTHIKPRAYLRGGGVQGVQTPPKFSDFFLKSEGKEIERKRKKRDVGGGGVVHLNIFLGLIFMGVEKFSWGVEKISGGGG